VTRIRGAILDDLRRQDWMPRSSRSRSRRLAAARAQLQSRLLRAPRPAEVALELGLNLEAYWRWCDELDAPALDAVRTSAGGGVRTGGAGDQPAHEPTEDASADRRLLREEEGARVRAAIEQLPDREQRVLALCYYEELTLKEVGELLGVTESRISQIRQQALRRLTGMLQG
jgi:RNA polymerase sigma factor for flagellar operon FliA